jgi:Protein of unknown function (DUF2634).
MSFPFDADNESEESEVVIPYEYGIDYETGELTGEIVEKDEAIKVWIYNALRIQRYNHVIYSWDYGNELNDLVGQTYDQEELEVTAKAMVEDCLSINEYINSIDDFTAGIDKDTLKISFTANTIFGEVKVSV